MHIRALRNWPNGWRDHLARDFFSSLFSRNREDFANVRTFCAFLGHSRSGHSVVASILDAHKNIVLSDELHTIKYYALPFSLNQIFRLIARNSFKIASMHRQRAGYSFEIPNQWQGKSELIISLGDKDGSFFADIANRNFFLVEIFINRLGDKLRMINLYRNPYDVISTIHRRYVEKSGPAPLEKSIDYFFHRQVGIEKVRGACGQVMDVCYEEFLEHPGETICRLCEFLLVEAEPTYLDACTKVVFPSATNPRFAKDWTDDQIELVKVKKAAFSYLRNYQF